MFSSYRCESPEYLLDFGIVIPKGPVSQTVIVTNNGLIPVSFVTNYKLLEGTGNVTPAPAVFTSLLSAQNRTFCVFKGFSAEFPQKKTLVCGQTQTFTVTFDPNECGLTPGRRSVLLLIQVLTDL